mmetsp:Transcript_231/g.635  ORF Transcript_231/g.635 Transcript_231/m.635 type:complete len:386 (-) Transcript_231:237-1394(-)
MGRRKAAWKAIGKGLEGVRERSAVEMKRDQSLFFIDRAGKEKKKKRKTPQLTRKRNKKASEEVISKAALKPAEPVEKKTFYDKRATKKRKRKRSASKSRSQGEVEDVSSIPGVRKHPNRIAPKVTGMDIWGAPPKSTGKTSKPNSLSKHKAPLKPQSIASLAKSKYSKPLAAQSYNPTKDDQQKLIQSAGTLLQKKLAEKEKVQKELKDVNPDLPYVDPYYVEYNEEPSPFPGGNPVVRAEDRLTRQQRRKKTARKTLEEAQKAKELSKQQKQDLHRLKGIVRQISKDQKISDNKRKQRQVQKKADEVDPMKCKLGKYKFEPMFPEVLLSDEVTGHLRDTELASNAVAEQFKRLQERKMIEPRKKQRKRKPRYKRKRIKIHKWDE